MQAAVGDYVRALLHGERVAGPAWEPDADIDYWCTLSLALRALGVATPYHGHPDDRALHGQYAALAASIPLSDDDPRYLANQPYYDGLHTQLKAYYRRFKQHCLLVADVGEGSPQMHRGSLMVSMRRLAGFLRSMQGQTCVLPLTILMDGANGGAEAHTGAVVFHASSTIYVIDPLACYATAHPVHSALHACMPQLRKLLGNRRLRLAPAAACFAACPRRSLQGCLAAALPHDAALRGCCGLLTLLVLAVMARFDCFHRPAATMHHIGSALLHRRQSPLSALSALAIISRSLHGATCHAHVRRLCNLSAPIAHDSSKPHTASREAVPDRPAGL